MNRQRAYGFSLTEILVALLISSILMYGVVSMMASSKRTYGLQNELAKLQDNARFIVEDIAYSLRMTGFRGCVGMNVSAKEFFDNQPVIDGKNDEPIEVAEVEGDIPTSGSIMFPLTKDSDTLGVRFLGSTPPLEWFDNNGDNKHDDDDEGLYSPRFQKPVDKIFLWKDSFVPEKHATVSPSYVVVTDCTRRVEAQVVESTVQGPNVPAGEAEMGTPYIKLGNYQPSDFNTSVPFERPIDIFPIGAAASAKDSGVFYHVVAIKKARKEAPGTSCPYNFVLYRGDKPDGSDPGKPFVEGVENLQIRYGLQRSGGMTYSDKRPNSNDLVQSIRVTLLMRTLQKRFDIKDTTDKAFRLDNFIYNPTEESKNDPNQCEVGYRHRLFTSTISVRNANFSR